MEHFEVIESVLNKPVGFKSTNFKDINHVIILFVMAHNFEIDHSSANLRHARVSLWRINQLKVGCLAL